MVRRETLHKQYFLYGGFPHTLHTFVTAVSWIPLDRSRWLRGRGKSWCWFLNAAPRRLVPCHIFRIHSHLGGWASRYGSCRRKNTFAFHVNIYHQGLFISCAVFACWFRVIGSPRVSFVAPTYNYRRQLRCLAIMVSWKIKLQTTSRRGCTDTFNFSLCFFTEQIHQEQVSAQDSLDPTPHRNVISGLWSFEVSMVFGLMRCSFLGISIY